LPSPGPALVTHPNSAPTTQSAIAAPILLSGIPAKIDDRDGPAGGPTRAVLHSESKS